MSRKNGNGEGSSNSPPVPELPRRTTSGGSSGSGEVLSRRRTDPFLVICRFFGVVTALAGILSIAVNVLSAVRSFKDGSDVFDGIFRCYAVIVAALVVVAETEWSFIFRFWKVLEYWVGRGMLQIFVAVMTRAFPSDETTLVFLQNISCYLLIGCGVVYIVSGILCMGYIKRARQKKETTRSQTINDLEELERRREELEALLMENRA